MMTKDSLNQFGTRQTFSRITNLILTKSADLCNEYFIHFLKKLFIKSSIQAMRNWKTN